MYLKKLSLFILVIFVSLSKEILVFNEEILVFLSFILFSFISYDFVSNLFSSELNLRSLKIKEDFNFVNSVQEKTFIHLISYYNKQQLLCEKIQFMFLTIDKIISSFLNTITIVYFKLLVSSIDEKLRKTYFSQLKIFLLQQERINLELFCFLIFIYKNRTRRLSSGKKTSLLTLLNSISFSSF